MTDEKLNQILQQTLTPIVPDKKINQKLKEKMEERNMKHFNIRKSLVLTAACCMLFGAVGIASSGVVSYIKTQGISNEYTKFSELSKAEKMAGYRVKAVENFDNGYHFKDMSVINISDCDENDNEVSEYKGLNFVYIKDEENNLYIDTQRVEDTHYPKQKTPQKATEINKIQVKYYVDTYKWVPVGYELTDEDKKNMQKSDYYISEGADEVSQNQISYVACK